MSFTPGPDTVGEIEPLSLWSGQGVALVRKVQTAAEIVREMNEEAMAFSDGSGSIVHRNSCKR
jgi:nitronate monooxygenase